MQSMQSGSSVEALNITGKGVSEGQTFYLNFFLLFGFGILYIIFGILYIIFIYMHSNDQ